jgi:peptidylprolyl isomerase
MRFLCLVTVFVLAGCARPKLPASIPAVPGTLRTQYAMRYVDVKIGSGALAEPGKLYVVHYTGWLRDGKKFDSSRDKGQPLSFEQGKRRVIPGWDAGFEGMRVGGQRRLFIPYQLAYGEMGRGPIPPKAELIFDVELLDVKEPPPAAPAK